MKAVLFDLGHTLIDYYCDWKAPEERGIRRIADLVARNSSAMVDDAEVAGYIAALLSDARERKAREMIEIPLEEVMGRCLDRYGCLEEDLLQETLEIFYGVLLEERRPVPGAKELLARIKDRGLAIGLVSDVAWGLPSEYPQRDMRHFGLHEYFDDMVFSTDVGLRKPHPRIFKIALSNVRASPRDAMFVGNSLLQDVKGAQGVGMRAVLKRSGFCPREDGVVPDATVSELEEILELID